MDNTNFPLWPPIWPLFETSQILLYEIITNFEHKKTANPAFARLAVKWD